MVRTDRGCPHAAADPQARDRQPGDDLARRAQAGCDVPSHSHANEQFAVLLSGTMRFGLGEPRTTQHREVTLHAGEVLHLPSNLPHSAYAVEESVILDIFSPPSQKTGIDRA